MADFSIISDVSNEVLKLLRENICPELIQSQESITLAAPTDKNADFQMNSRSDAQSTFSVSYESPRRSAGLVILSKIPYRFMYLYSSRPEAFIFSRQTKTAVRRAAGRTAPAPCC